MAHGIYVGTSGWTYDDWDGVFYPEGVRGAERLAYYATRFDTVEVNATFYRFPSAAMIAAWNQRLLKRFHLVVKGHRMITHRRNLLSASDPLRDFLERIEPLESLRAVLWQLPPQLHRDVDRLDEFLALLPRGDLRHAFEFRHESWWDDDVATCLRRHRATFVAVSHPELPGDVIPTSQVLYVRFHGEGRELYHYDYSELELRRWARRLEPHLGSRRLYAFFNNDRGANAVGNAERFRELLGAKPPPG